MIAAREPERERAKERESQREREPKREPESQRQRQRARLGQLQSCNRRLYVYHFNVIRH